jgi:hypothetical protein
MGGSTAALGSVPPEPREDVGVGPKLTPADLREGLASTAVPLDGVDKARQGAGVVRARRAVEWAIERR